MLPKGKQCRGKRISLLAAFRLADVTAGTGIIPPAIHRWLPVKQAHKRQERGGDLAKLAEEGGPGDGVVRTAAVQRHHGHVWISLQRDAESRHQGVHTGPRAQGVLIGTGRLVEGSRPSLRQGPRD